MVNYSIPITLVELPPTQYGKLNAEISRDIYSHLKLDARALPILEAVLIEQGYTNVQSIIPNLQNSKGKLTGENLSRAYSSFFLGLSVIARTSQPSIEFLRMCKRANPEVIIGIGGPDAGARAEDYLNRGADVVVRGEGERTLVEIMQRAEKSRDFSGIKGITWRKGSQIIVEKDRELMTSDELSRLPHPVYNIKTRKAVDVGVVETTRGCPNACDYCCVTQNFGHTYRTKSIEYVIEEIRRIREQKKYIFFTDDNFAGNPQRTVRLLEAMISEGFGKTGTFQVQVTAKAAKNPRMLELFRRAGINTLYVGFESLSDASLNEINKPSDAQENREAAKIFREYGFWTHGMMIAGLDGDTRESLREMLDWSLGDLDSVQYFAINPLPGTPFEKRMRKEKRILTRDFSLYDGMHVLTRPKNFSPYELQQEIYNMYKKFYSFSELAKRLTNAPRKGTALTVMSYITFLGGIKRILSDPQSVQHLEFLKSVS